MPTPKDDLNQLLKRNPWISAAWLDDPIDPTQLHVIDTGVNPSPQIEINAQLDSLTMIRHKQKPLEILIARPNQLRSTSAHQRCQDEPIRCGCQIQPRNANWVGTAGAPVRWINKANQTRFGILSNWHVMADGDQRTGRPIHQPDSSRPTMATLTAWSAVTSSADNTIDAAIADCLIDGFHTVDPNILEVGRPADHTLDAQPGLQVQKAGRTTGLTKGTCTAVGAAVRIGYGDFSATFTDQDIFEARSVPFSAPGDSGSLIVTQAANCPVSLLFAGNDQITIANPIRFIVNRFNLRFPFTQEDLRWQPFPSRPTPARSTSTLTSPPTGSAVSSRHCSPACPPSSMRS